MENSKVILCYGDSNTWGYIPLSGERFPKNKRWPEVLQRELGKGYCIISEGLNGRATVWDEPFRPGRNGLTLLLPLLHSHQPLDLVVVMLGTNDLKNHLHVNAHESGRGLAALIQTIQTSGAGVNGHSPQILILSIPKFGTLSEQMTQHFGTDTARSETLAQIYEETSRDKGCKFFDVNRILRVGADGIHLDESGHARLGQALAPVVMDMIG